MCVVAVDEWKRKLKLVVAVFSRVFCRRSGWSSRSVVKLHTTAE